MWKKLLRLGGACLAANTVYCTPEYFGHVIYPANLPVEDNSMCAELNNIRLAAIYDGHGGWQVSEYLHRHMFQRIKDVKEGTREKWPKVLRLTFDIIENEVRESAVGAYKLGFGDVALVGSCAIVSMVFDSYFIVANSGDSKAVLVTITESGVRGTNICAVHSLAYKTEREKLKKEHPGEEDVVDCKLPTACYVKGRQMQTRAFGDFNLKYPEFNNPEDYKQLHGFRRPRIENFSGPYITHKPDIQTRDIKKGDKFLILASDGLWDEVSVQEAAETIADCKSPQEAAEKLMYIALNNAAEKNLMTLESIALLPQDRRHAFHDDISIIVIPLFG